MIINCKLLEKTVIQNDSSRNFRNVKFKIKNAYRENNCLCDNKVFIIIPFLLLLVSHVFCVHASTKINESENSTAIYDNVTFTSAAKLNSAFSYGLYKVINKVKRGNFIISPLAFGNGLTIFLAGANGTTAQEIYNVLQNESFSKYTDSSSYNLPGLMNYLKKRLPQEQKNDSFDFKFASHFYLAKEFQNMNPEFVHTVQWRLKESAPVVVDFARNFETASKINDWISSAMDNEIKFMISPGNLYGFTKAVYVNAIYCKGKWKDEFRPESVKKGYFFTMDRGAVFVDVMEKIGIFQHAFVPEIDSTAIKIPYQGDEWSMAIVLPNEGMKLSKVELKLKTFPLSSIFYKMEKRHVKLRLPKFRIESHWDFVDNGIAAKLGLRSMINSTMADFGQISSNPGLYINSMIQKTVLEVGEDAVNISSGPEYISGNTRSLRYTTPFLAERPFIVIIYNEILSTPLMIGRKVR